MFRQYIFYFWFRLLTKLVVTLTTHYTLIIQTVRAPAQCCDYSNLWGYALYVDLALSPNNAMKRTPAVTEYVQCWHEWWDDVTIDPVAKCLFSWLRRIFHQQWDCLPSSVSSRELVPTDAVTVSDHVQSHTSQLWGWHVISSLPTCNMSIYYGFDTATSSV